MIAICRTLSSTCQHCTRHKSSPPLGLSTLLQGMFSSSLPSQFCCTVKTVRTGWSHLTLAWLIMLLPQFHAALAQRCGIAMCRAVYRGWSHQGRSPIRPWPTAASWTWPRPASTCPQPPALMRSRLDSEPLAQDATCVGLLHA